MKILVKVFVLLLILADCACAGLTEHQKILAGCESVSASMEALTAAKQAGRISKAQLDQAIAIDKKTVPFCEPPAQSLGAIEKAALDAAVADLLARAGNAK